MQIGSQLPASPAIDTRISSASRGTAVASLARPDDAAPVTRARTYTGTLSGAAGLRAWNPQFNAEVGRAQLAADYLDEGTGQLRSLKSSLSQQIPAGRGDVALQRRLDRFAQLWSERGERTAGALGPQLDFDATVPARQRFGIPGLDLNALQTGDSENLFVSFAGAGRNTPVVALEDGLGAREIVRRFDHALAASGVRAEAEGSRLVFSVAEADWPALRDTLALRGGGIRWPTGQFARVNAQPVPDRIDPEQWSVTDADAMRSTLQGTLAALDAFRAARQDVDTAMAQMEQTVSSERPDMDAGQAAAFASAFESLGQSRSYTALAQFAAALSGMRRDRVQALLELI